jgi:hypothetical protein
MNEKMWRSRKKCLRWEWAKKIAAFFDRFFRTVLCTDSWRAQSQQINRKYKNFDVLHSFVLYLLRHCDPANSNEICEWELECERKFHEANWNVLMWFHFSLSKQTESRYAPELLVLNMTDTKLNFILLNVTACNCVLENEKHVLIWWIVRSSLYSAG